ncbi:hypothetical protein BST61_g3281 [Cercospora zeina]
MCRYCGVLVGECLAPLIRRTVGVVQKRAMSTRVAYRPATRFVQPAASQCSAKSFSTSASLCRKGGKAAREEKKAETKDNGTAATDDPYDFADLETTISDTLEKLKTDLSRLRAGGRFNPEVVENLRVQPDKQSNQTVKLNDVAQVIPKGRTVQILVGEKDHVKPVSSAIQSSSLSLTPQPDPTGQNPLLLVLNIPPPTAESRKAVIDEAVKAGDKASTSVKDARGKQQKKFRALQLNKSARPDDLKKAGTMMEKVVEKATAELKKVVDNAKKVVATGSAYLTSCAQSRFKSTYRPSPARAVYASTYDTQMRRPHNLKSYGSAKPQEDEVHEGLRVMRSSLSRHYLSSDSKYCICSTSTSPHFCTMSSAKYPLRNSGIYRNLPTFDPSIKGLTALICGGTGISGFHALRALLDSPERWSTIFILSRSPLPEQMSALLTEAQRQRTKHISVNLQDSPEKIAQNLREAHVKPDYIFFYSYMTVKTENAMDPKTSQKLHDLNVPLFDNFLQSLPKAAIQPKRILLQTGGKHYGVHLGRVRNPVSESDPPPKHLQPTQFYYEQVRLLEQYCKEHSETDWNIVRPFPIIGSVMQTWLNSFYPFGVYAAVQAHKGEPLEFGGDWEAWQFGYTMSTARMTGYLSEWAVLEPTNANQAFNATDGSLLSFDHFFHELARWFSCSKGVKLPSPDSHRSFPKTLSLAGGEASPLGYGPPLETPLEFTLADWARKAENREAWKEIRERSGGEKKIVYDPFESDEEIDNTFLGDYAYLRYGVIGQDKARRAGWTGYVDTLEAVFETFGEFAKVGMLPEMEVDKARPMG